MGLKILLKCLNDSGIEIKPRGTTGFYLDGKILRPKGGVQLLYQLLEDELGDNKDKVASYVIGATESDGNELISGIQRLHKQRVKQSVKEHLGGLDASKSFEHKGLTPIRDIETGKRGLFDTAKDTISPLDYDTWYDKLPPDKDQRALIMENEILSLMEYDPYTLLSKKFVTYDEQEIYQFNSHVAPAWRFVEEPTQCPEFFLDFMEHFIPDEECRQYVINWMHEMIFGRNQTILTLVSTKGTGKNIFMEICEALVGKRNYQIHSEDMFKSQFMGELENKRLVTFDETTISLKYKEKLKRITNEYFSIEKKGKEVELGKKNHASYIIANNVFDGNHIDSDDRRFSVIDITEVRLLERFSDDEIDSFLEGLRNNPEIICGIGQYIVANHDANFENHIPYKGVKFYELRYWSLALWKKFIVDLVQERKEPYYTMDTVKDEYEIKLNQRFFPSNNTVQKWLDEWKDFDGDKIANIDKIEGDWCLNPSDKYQPEDTQEEFPDDFDL